MATVTSPPPPTERDQPVRGGAWWTPALLLAGVALPVVLVAAAASGALEPLVLGDAGPMVRVGIPVSRVLHDLLAATTVGLLLVAGFLVPEGRRTERRATAARLATATGAGWAVTAAAGLVLAFAGAAGLPPSAPGFWDELATNLWPLELTRLLAVEAALAGAVTLAAAVARTRAALAWTFALALAALIPLGFSGHASSTEGHEQAVTGLTAHVLGVTVWLGGLTAVLLLRPVLGRAVTVTVQRYSTVALWAFVAVAGSGVLLAALAVAEPADVLTPYWLLLWGKVAALAALGWLGLQQRRVVIAHGLERTGTFVRFALTELVVMAAAVGLAVALSRTVPPEQPAQLAGDPVLELTGYPAPAPYEASVWLTVWRTDWLFVPAAVLAVGLYLAAVHRLRRRGDRWPWGRTVLWVLGWVLFAYVTSGAAGVYGRVMFSVHMIGHMALMMAVPIFLVLAAPLTLAMRTLPARRDATLGPREVLLGLAHSRYAAAVVNPVVAGVVFFGSLVAFYWTDLFAWALTSHAGHVAMVVHFTLTGYAFVWALIGTDPGPPKWPAPLRLVVLFATVAAHAFFGLALMQGTWLLAPGFFKALALPWVPDLLADQQLAGAIAWGVGELPTLVLALLVTRDWVRSDAREARRHDRRAERDDDAELAAYNARLQQIAQRTADREGRAP